MIWRDNSQNTRKKSVIEEDIRSFSGLHSATCTFLVWDMLVYKFLTEQNALPDQSGQVVTETLSILQTPTKICRRRLVKRQLLKMPSKCVFKSPSEDNAIFVFQNR